MSYRQIIRTLAFGLFSVLVVSETSFAQTTCSAETKTLNKEQKQLDKAEGRLERVEESNARRLQARVDRRDRLAALEADAARKQNECSSLGNIFIGGVQINRAYQCDRRWSVKKHNYRVKKQQTQTYIDTVLIPRNNTNLARQQSRVAEARARRDAAQTALNLCQNPPPAP